MNVLTKGCSSKALLFSIRRTWLKSSLAPCICEWYDGTRFMNAHIFSDAVPKSQLRERVKFSGAFSSRILDVDLQRLNVVSETIDTPISIMEVSKHPGAEQDLVKSGSEQDIFWRAVPVSQDFFGLLGSPIPSAACQGQCVRLYIYINLPCFHIA